MGKIRIKTLGDEETEKKQAAADKKRAEAKRAEKQSSDVESQITPTTQTSPASPKTGDLSAGRQGRRLKTTKSSPSKSYRAAASLLDPKKIYTLSEALEVLPKLKRAKFDETVELHINTTGTGINGSMTLPHGAGKDLRVVVATDEVITQIENGQIDFDILLAEPQLMPKLARVAKVLGPRGLMPNPKNGTITPNPAEAAKKYQGGLMNYKTEAKFPLLHLRVGKVSFGEDKLKENIKTAVKEVDLKNIKSVTLKSTMSPGIQLDAATA